MLADQLITSYPINWDVIAQLFIKQYIDFLVKTDDYGRIICTEDGMGGEWTCMIDDYLHDYNYDRRVRRDDDHVTCMLKALKKYCVKCPSSADQLNDWDSKYNHIVLKHQYLPLFTRQLNGYYVIDDHASPEDWPEQSKYNRTSIQK